MESTISEKETPEAMTQEQIEKLEALRRDRHADHARYGQHHVLTL